MITEIGSKILRDGDFDACLFFAGVNNITRKVMDASSDLIT